MSGTSTPPGTILEIPTSPLPQTFSVALSNTLYTFTLTYRNAPLTGWILDIADSNGVGIIAGIPLLCGVSMLGQYAYLGIPGDLFCANDDQTDAPPTFANLGVTSHLYYVTP